ncbi:MAG: hypothetical protein ABL858_03870 [Candidatus Nitrotoga sp.]
MKKIIFSALAGLLAMISVTQQASAVPAFARQTGMVCVACHQQHFPVLNIFGQSFKAGGYTMTGLAAEPPIEGDYMSIPGDLNAALVLKGRYVKTNGKDPANTVSGTTINSGEWNIPDEFSLFFGGRIANNMGFLFEGNTTSPAGLIAGFKMPTLFDVGDVKLGITPYVTDTLGPFYGYDLASTGQTRGVRWAEHRLDISAQQYTGMGAGPATGFAFSAQHELGYISFSRFSPNFLAPEGIKGVGGTAVAFKSNLLRVAATPSVGDWDVQVGLGLISGSNYVEQDDPVTLGIALTAADKVDTKARSLDFQAFGKVGKHDLSVYATYAVVPYAVPVVGVTAGNAYHMAGVTSNVTGGGNFVGTNDVKAFTIGAEYSVVPHALHLGAAYRNAKNGDVAAFEGDNSITLTAVYNFRQNVMMQINHSMRSGSSYDAGGANDTTLATHNGKSLTTFMLATAF